MLIALVGNQNCGKTTLFNALTGSNQHVGNFPGVTVDAKIGIIKDAKEKIEIVDLPGIYSLSPYSQEEIVGVTIMKEAMQRVLEIKQLHNIQEQCLNLMKQKAEGGINEHE